MWLHRMGKRYLLFVVAMLLIACYAAELPSPCTFVEGQASLTCSVQSQDVHLSPGGTTTVTLSCCLVDNATNTPNPRILVNRRDEWFYTPPGSDQSMRELYPGTQYITNIQAPSTTTGGEVFDVKLTFTLPPNFQFTQPSTPARVDVSADLQPEPIPMFVYTPSIVQGPVCGNQKCEPGETSSNCCKDCGCSLGYSCQQNSCKQLNPVQDVINTVRNWLGGGGGDGGGFSFLAPPQSEQEEPQPGQESQGQTENSQLQQGGPQPEQGKEPTAGQNETTGPEKESLKIEIPIVNVDLSLNYTLLGAGIVSLLVIGVIVWFMRPV